MENGRSHLPLRLHLRQHCRPRLNIGCQSNQHMIYGWRERGRTVNNRPQIQDLPKKK